MSNRSMQQCESSIYHIIERGVGRQIIFEDNADRRRFGEKMVQSADRYGIKVLAWCLMDNHVHLLLKGAIEDISSAMKSLNISYARYFNGRHNRVGTLFQGRFASVPVKDDQQFIAVLRYIHKNPESFGAGAFQSYAWSSYREYLGEKGALGPSVDAGYVLGIVGGVEQFVRIHQQEGMVLQRFEKDDLDTLEEFANTVLGDTDRSSVKSLPKPLRDEKIRALHRAGLSIRQIERITSIGRNIIARAVK